MNKTIIGIVLGVVVLGGLVWMARPDAKKSISGGDTKEISSGTLAVVGSSSFDFGSISMGAGKVKTTFKVKNTGDETVIISKLYTSCMCTTATLEVGGKKLGPYGMQGHGVVPTIKQAVKPGEEASIEVVFDPAAHGPAGVGRIERVVVIENNAGEPVQLQFSAVVTP